MLPNPIAAIFPQIITSDHQVEKVPLISRFCRKTLDQIYQMIGIHFHRRSRENSAAFTMLPNFIETDLQV